jgi:hypothetical protein
MDLKRAIVIGFACCVAALVILALAGINAVLSVV